MRDIPYWLLDMKRARLDRCRTDAEKLTVVMEFWRKAGVSITEGDMGKAITYALRRRNTGRPYWRMADNIGLGKYIGARAKR